MNVFICYPRNRMIIIFGMLCGTLKIVTGSSYRAVIKNQLCSHIAWYVPFSLFNIILKSIPVMRTNLSPLVRRKQGHEYTICSFER